MPKLKVFGAFVAAIIVLVIGAGAYLYWTWHHPLEPGTDTYLVKPGTSMRGLAQQLYERGVIPEPHSLRWLGYVSGRSRQLKAGEYRFRPHINAVELLDQVVAGRVIEYPVIFVEGWNFSQVMKALAAAPKLTQTLTGLTPAQIMARLGHPELHPEGRFFPDTYYYSTGSTDLAILTRAFKRMQTRLEEEWERRAADLPLPTMDEALVMASVIEKETGDAAERRQIAGVFINRLRKRMKLQSDPTVIYGMGVTYNGNIRLVDLRRDNAYNTYTRYGLPPTPIAMPGAESLAAALHPDDTDALYFVARGDGSHVFSDTLQEHNAAVIKYLLGGKASVGR
ncbi:MAG: endolytic transglycosylase MltG [Gammaproteobacteria bacterium]|nr:endolytic transglycosylase MltG [Gammaproteobacteria bacterium]